MNARINLDAIRENGETNRIIFIPENNTGIGRPAIAALDDGCVIAFAVEQEDKWRIAYSFISGNTRDPILKYVETDGTSSISPSLSADLWAITPAAIYLTDSHAFIAG